MGLNTKSSKFFSCLNNHTKSGDGLLAYGFLACVVRVGGPS